MKKKKLFFFYPIEVWADAEGNLARVVTSIADCRSINLRGKLTNEQLWIPPKEVGHRFWYRWVICENKEGLWSLGRKGISTCTTTGSWLTLPKRIVPKSWVKSILNAQRLKYRKIISTKSHLRWQGDPEVLVACLLEHTTSKFQRVTGSEYWNYAAQPTLTNKRGLGH